MKICIGDIEADGLLYDATKIWCGVFKDIDTNEVVQFYPDDDNYIKHMFNYLDNVDVLIMHNGLGYDWPLMERLYNYKYKGKKVDTLILSRLYNPKRISPPNCPNKTAPHSVEAWGYRLGHYKPEHEDWSQYTSHMLHRCTEDVHIQHKIFNKLMEETKGFEWREASILTTRLFEIINMQMDYGWKVDKDHINKSIHMLEHWIERIDKVITPMLPLITIPKESKKEGVYNYVKKPFKRNGELVQRVIDYFTLNSSGMDNPNVVGPFSRVDYRYVDLDSNKEVKQFLLDNGWEPMEWNYNNDGEKTSAKLSKDDPFEGIEGGVGRLVARRVQCRQRMGILNGWSDVIRDDGRIPSVVSGIAATGRAKHSIIVNVPGEDAFFGKWMRKTFIADKDKVLVGTDSDACQIRMLCARMDDPEYTNTVLNGKKEDGTDIHSVNMRAAGLPTRHSAKTFFYGLIFGAGDAKTGKVVKGNAQDGKRLKRKFFEGLPALQELVERLTEEWKSNAKTKWNSKFNRMEYYNGWIKGLDDRPIYIPSEHMVLVYALQSDEAIMMARAIVKFYDDMTEAGYTFGKEYGIVNWNHDEWTTECDPDIKDFVADKAENAIKWAGEFYNIKCPHEGQAAIGNDWWSIH